MALVVFPKRGFAHLVSFDPVVGSETRKTRPCVIVSPDELNGYLQTAIVAPMTSGGKAYPWRIPCQFQQKPGVIALDQIGTVERKRLIRPLGKLAPETTTDLLSALRELFAI